jgi:hypothetical protein
MEVILRFRTPLFSAIALVVLAMPARAQDINENTVAAFIRGLNAEKPELSKVADQVKELDTKIQEFKKCSELLREGLSGLKLKVALKA